MKASTAANDVERLHIGAGNRPDVIRHRQVLGAVPAGVVQHQHHVALAPRPAARSGRVASRRMAGQGRWTEARPPSRAGCTRQSRAARAAQFRASHSKQAVAFCCPDGAGHAYWSSIPAERHLGGNTPSSAGRVPPPRQPRAGAGKLDDAGSGAAQPGFMRQRSRYPPPSRLASEAFLARRPATPGMPVGFKDPRHHLAAPNTCALHSCAIAG